MGINAPSDLAIVIPAYKADYLDAALASLARQSDQDFVVYVGDDASPCNLVEIVEKWKPKLNIVYTRFDSNVGSTSLIQQWTRCMNLSHESWVWLFSDDDIAEASCVAAWRECLGKSPGADIFHFNVDIIDCRGGVIRSTTDFPENITARQFLYSRFRYELSSFAAEYIFRRSAFDQCGGFEEFPLAWCSDDATWFKVASKSGIRTVNGSRVFWRLSGANLSSRNPLLAEKKIEACIRYLQWIHTKLSMLAPSEAEPDNLLIARASYNWFFLQLRSQSKIVDLSQSVRIANVFGSIQLMGKKRTFGRLLLTNLVIAVTNFARRSLRK